MPNEIITFLERFEDIRIKYTAWIGKEKPCLTNLLVQFLDRCVDDWLSCDATGGKRQGKIHHVFIFSHITYAM